MKSNQTQLEAKLFKGFADKSRLLILETISDGPKTVTEIVEETKLSQPNTSAHLACLLDCGLVKNKKKRREVFYQVSMKEIGVMLNTARKILSKHSKEINKCTNY